jgi:hypothetical protein
MEDFKINEIELKDNIIREITINIYFCQRYSYLIDYYREKLYVINVK